MEFSFNTPDLPARDPQTIHVDLCGELLELDKPKDWTLANARTAVSEAEIPPNQRAQATTKFLVGTLGQEAYDRLLHRSADRDDPINMAALRDFIEQALARWADYDPNDNPTIVVVAPPGGLVGEPVSLRGMDQLGMQQETVTIDPPKDILLMIFQAMAVGNEDAQHWAAEMIMEATFPHELYRHLVTRLTTKNDPLDVEHLDPILAQLIEYWNDNADFEPQPAPANREERRAAARHRAPHQTA